MVSTVLNQISEDDISELLNGGKMLIESFKTDSGFHCHINYKSTWHMDLTMIIQNIESGKKYLYNVDYNGGLNIDKKLIEILNLNDLVSRECRFCKTSLNVEEATINADYDIICKDPIRCKKNITQLQINRKMKEIEELKSENHVD